MNRDKKLDELHLLQEIAEIHDLITDVQEMYGEHTAGPSGLSELYDRAVALHFLRHDINKGAERIECAVIGDFNAGKSSFINSLAGAPICPVGACPTTSSITRFHYGPTATITDDNGRQFTPEEYARAVQHPDEKVEGGTQAYVFNYAYPFDILRDLMIIDTPGFANPDNPSDTELTIEHVKSADAIFYLINIDKGEIGATELEIIQKLKSEQEESTPWYLILNKADMKVASAATRLRDIFTKKYAHIFSEVFLYSAKTSSADGDSNTHTYLSYIAGEIESQMMHSRNFSMELAGKPGIGNYKVSVGNKVFTLSAKREHISGPQEIISALRKLALKRAEILRMRYEHEEARYRAHRTNALELLRGSLRSGPANPRGDKQVDLMKMLEKALSNLGRRASSLTPELTSSSVNVRELSNEESAYWFTADAVIEITYQRVAPILKRRKYMIDQFVDEVQNIAHVEKRTYSTSILSRYLAHIKNISKEHPPKFLIHDIRKQMFDIMSEALIKDAINRGSIPKSQPHKFASMEDANIAALMLVTPALEEEMPRVLAEIYTGYFREGIEKLGEQLRKIQATSSVEKKSSEKRKKIVDEKIAKLLARGIDSDCPGQLADVAAQ